MVRFGKDSKYRTKVIMRKRQLSKILFIVKVTLTFDPKINMILPLPQGNHVVKLVKIQYTELKLSCGNDPVVKNSIYSNGDLEFLPNDPKINRVLPLPQGNHVAKFGKDPIYRTKVILRKPSSIYGF